MTSAGPVAVPSPSTLLHSRATPHVAEPLSQISRTDNAKSVDNSETTMRTFLFAASAAALTILSTVQLVSAAATIPDYELHVNTRSAYDSDGRNIDILRDAANGPAVQSAEHAEPEWLEIPARR
jgi:hypothetical protein